MRAAAAVTHAPTTAAHFDLRGAIRLFPSRVKNPHFWMIQTVIGLTTALHYGLEASDFGSGISSTHIPVTFYLIAVLYAGIQFRLEGGILTALWVVAITMPSILIWHRDSLMWLGEMAQLLVSLGVGTVVAWRVELEMTHRRAAEAANRRASLLHDVSSAASQSLDLQETLPGVLERVTEALSSERAWISVWESPSDAPDLIAEVGEPICVEDFAGRPRPVWQVISQEVQRTSEPATFLRLAIAVPLMAEGKLFGALGVGCRGGQQCTLEEVELLAAMGGQIAMALDNARLYRDEIRMREALRVYARQVTQAHEEERKRIARELHDDVVQDLVLICRELDNGSGAASAETGSEPGGVRKLTESLLQKVRRFSRDLRPSVLDDLGLIPAIEWLGADLSKRTGMIVAFEVSGDAARLPPERELLVFRVVQEALRNVEKHAAASQVELSMVFRPDDVQVSVVDDGKGFKLAGLRTGDYSGKLGLLGMQERAKLAGAALEVTSQPGKGSRIQVTVPIGDRPTEN